MNGRSTRKIRARTALAVLLSAGLLATAACGDSSDGGEPKSGPSTAAAGYKEGFVNGGDATGTAVKGGQLTMAVYAETASLDPANTPGTGYIGGTELTAIFDVLVRFDPITGKYQPQLAESLTPNADNTEWTLTLRPDVTFSDGTPLDAQAVKTSLTRMATKGRAGWPISQNVQTMTVKDPRTLVLKLNKSLAAFPYALAYNPGWITHPDADAKGEAYGRAPIGAGPYTVEKYAPGEEIVLKARDDYWGGRPNIDTLRFVPIVGDKAKLEALDSGTVDLAFLGEPTSVRDALQAGRPGFMTLSNYGQALLVNTAAGRPTADPKVRQAIAYAINPDVINQRVNNGAGVATKQLYGSTSRYFTPDAQALPYDPAKAKQLLEEAKAAGYDGKLKLVSSSSPMRSNLALATEALLEAVGFEVDTDVTGTIADQTRKVNIEKNFDISTSGPAYREQEPAMEITKTLKSDSLQNASNYKSPQMDGLLQELAAAKDLTEVKSKLTQIQNLINQDLPIIGYATIPEMLVWGKNVKGIEPTITSSLILTKAWIER
ncbi:ABC transporter substrate-binding protein [Phytohabitans sp. ZYX-F-186]|uniref:ABC transporter substrate-binding protein n=1 Tax=Phytohabitans maris TaxID=3071409 RepID=A0ABU0ZCQ8_9ACTN|nr:ABC transporter substrate-binding protein [Phytohabitans sp. ZYX-F-186]MDQ7903712.1 ABC transporter substrate-binding protein [Phytohabitans sp. ZYX-F-186]